MVARGLDLEVRLAEPEEDVDVDSIAHHGVRPGQAEMVNDRAKLIMHRLIARRLKEEPSALTLVRERLDSLADDAPLNVAEWRAILQGDVDTVRRRLTERSSEMTRLRLSSPFLGVVPLTDPTLRRRIHQKAKLGARGEIDWSLR
jgi:hypothetical protein